jgi:hypothetical protein
MSLHANRIGRNTTIPPPLHFSFDIEEEDGTASIIKVHAPLSSNTTVEADQCPPATRANTTVDFEDTSLVYPKTHVFDEPATGRMDCVSSSNKEHNRHDLSYLVAEISTDFPREAEEVSILDVLANTSWDKVQGDDLEGILRDAVDSRPSLPQSPPSGRTNWPSHSPTAPLPLAYMKVC